MRAWGLKPDMTEIEIRNYQSIGHVKFAIDGFTTVVGKNNIGKSAVVRAITAALTNPPLSEKFGDSFIRKGQKSAEVHIKRGGLDVTWKRGASATYDVNGEPFSKLRGAIPPPLIEAGFREIEIGDDKFSPLIANQFDEIFLLDRSGPAVTEALSRMYKLDVIGAADDLCQKDQRAAKTLLKTREADLTTLEVQLKRYEGFEAVKAEITALRELETRCLKMQATVEEITVYRHLLETVANRVKKLQLVASVVIPDIDPQAMQECSWLNEKAQNYTEITERVKKLQGVSEVAIPDCDDVKVTMTEVGQLGKMLESLREIGKRFKDQHEALRMLETIPEVGDLEALFNEVSVLNILHSKLKAIADTVKQAKAELGQVESDMKQNREELDTFKVCPLCNQPREAE
jgi:archaellum component FlaC